MTSDSCTFSSCSSTRHVPAAVRPRSCVRQHEAGWNETGAALCHNLRHQPARKRPLLRSPNSRARRRVGLCLPMQSWLFVVLLSILLCSQQVKAGNAHGAHQLDLRTELIFDSREPPEPRGWLEKRTEPSHGDAHRAHGHATKPIHEDPGLETAGQESLLPLPRPFDTSLGNNFTTSSCPIFFNSFLTNDDFNNCLPLSLLLQVCASYS